MGTDTLVAHKKSGGKPPHSKRFAPTNAHCILGSASKTTGISGAIQLGHMGTDTLVEHEKKAAASCRTPNASRLPMPPASAAAREEPLGLAHLSLQGSRSRYCATRCGRLAHWAQEPGQCPAGPLVPATPGWRICGLGLLKADTSRQLPRRAVWPRQKLGGFVVPYNGLAVGIPFDLPPDEHRNQAKMTRNS